MSHTITPRVFVSAASSDLRSARKMVNEALTRIECLPIEESVFGTEYGPIRELLARKIESCQAVIHLVGRDYGGEPAPQTLPAGQPRRSWTQIEYDLAKGQQPKQKLYLLVCDDTFPFDPLTVPEPADKTAMQLAHRQAILADPDLWHTVRTADELGQAVERMKLPMDMLRAELTTVHEKVTTVGEQLSTQVSTVGERVTTSRRTLSRWMVAIVMLVLVTVGLGVYAAVQLQRSRTEARNVEQIGKQFAERFLDQLIRDKGLPVEVARRRALTELPLLLNLTTEKVQNLIDGRITALSKDAGATPLDRARAALTIADFDGVLKEESQQRIASREMAMLAGTAALSKFRQQPKPEWNEHALAAFQRELALSGSKTEPLAWAQSAISVADVLYTLGRFAEAEPLLREALKVREATCALPDQWIAIILNNLGQLLHATNRMEESELMMRRALAMTTQIYGDNHPDISIRLANLAQLLKDTNRLAGAENLMRRTLVIDEHFYGAAHDRIAMDVNNLAQLLLVTNRLAESEPLMRRALAINQQRYGDKHPTVAIRLNNLALLLSETNRFAEAEPLIRQSLVIDELSYGTQHPLIAAKLNNLAKSLMDTNHFAEAEPLLRRALVINEQSYGAVHPYVSNCLCNLGQVLMGTNRLAEAEPLMRRALAIDQQTSRAEHPDGARDLNNFAVLLQATSRVAESEPLKRRALDIDEQSYGPAHPKVAVDLNNVAVLLTATNRLPEAESLLRRVVTIMFRFRRETGHEHPYAQGFVMNYRVVLRSMTYPPDEIDRMMMGLMESIEPLKPIVPDVERLLGPAKPVADVLAALDRQYKADGKPDVYFLKPDQPISPHLDELCKPNPDSLNAAGLNEFRKGDHADAIVLYEESLKLLAGKPDDVGTVFTTRIYRAAALRELGELEQARDELRKLLSGLREGDTITALAKGRARYHLALCEWRLNDREAAQREAEESLKEFGDDADSAPQKKQTEQLLADLKENKPLPPLAKVDAVAALEQARVRFRARAELATLPLTQSALPLLDQMLGPAESPQQVFERLDRQYREQNKSAIWFLPLNQPIAPHLDELLGPLPMKEKE